MMARPRPRARARRAAFRTTLAVLAIAMPVAPAAAQALHAGPAYLHSANESIGGAAGVDVALSFPRAGGLALVLGASGMRHHFGRREAVCAGLIPPDFSCPVEPAAHRATQAMGRVALEFPLLRWPAGHLALGPELLAGHERTVTRGEESGRTLVAEAGRVGFGLSASLHHRPRRSSPVAIVLGGAVGATSKPGGGRTVDGYTPLDQGATATRISLAVSVDLARRR